MKDALWQDARIPCEPGNALWETFHENSKKRPTLDVVEFLDTDAIVRTTRQMDETLPYRTAEKVTLPPPIAECGTSVLQAICARRSMDVIGERPLALEALSTLLWAGYGITCKTDPAIYARDFRATPSAGALYPLELYVWAKDVTGLAAGIYHCHPGQQELSLIRNDTEVIDDIIASAFVPQVEVSAMPVLVFVTAMFRRTTFKYGARGYRFCLLEAGHVVHSMNLASTALHLGTRNLGGFFDQKIDNLLDIDGVSHSIIYCMGVADHA